MSFSHVVVVGRAGKDAELRSTSGGKTVANFNVAVDNGYGDSRITEWVPIVLFDKTADIAGLYVKKGSLVGITGRLQTRSWEDKTSGQTRYKTEVIGNELKLLDKAPSGDRSSVPAAPATSGDDPFADSEAAF